MAPTVRSPAISRNSPGSDASNRSQIPVQFGLATVFTLSLFPALHHDPQSQHGTRPCSPALDDVDGAMAHARDGPTVT